MKHILTALYNEFDDAEPESFELPPEPLDFVFDTYNGQPIDPDEEFTFTVSAHLEDGSVVHGSRPLIARTKVADKRCVQLFGKHPRFYIMREIMFKPNTVSHSDSQSGPRRSAVVIADAATLTVRITSLLLRWFVARAGDH